MAPSNCSNCRVLFQRRLPFPSGSPIRLMIVAATATSR